METSPPFSWIYIWSVILFGAASADDVYRYVVHTDPVVFEKALEQCNDSGGFLTTLSTKREEADILNRIAVELPSSSDATAVTAKFGFWVGLRKVRYECTVPHLTLKGFKWTADGSQESEDWTWNAEPKQTCTDARCVLMSGEMGPSSVRRWGLTPSTCRASHPFICKQRATEAEEPRAATPKALPDVHVARGATPRPGGGQVLVDVTPKPEPEPEPVPDPPQPGPVPDLPKLEPVPDPPQPGPVPDLPKLEPVPDPPQPGPAADGDSCDNPIIPGGRSLSPDPDDPRRMQVECWSGAVHWLTCSATTRTWEANGTSVENAGVCQKCEAGYEKDASGNCADIDECRDAACPHDCMNMEGSYKCICYDQHGNHHAEGSAACVPGGRSGSVNPTDKPDPSLTSPSDSSPGPTDDSGEVMIQDQSDQGILIPVLIAVVALVLLIVAVAVMVKCCLMRRSKKRAMRKAEKMAMQTKDSSGRDSMDTSNEKEAL